MDFIGFLNNPLVLTVIVGAWGMLARFYPKLKDFPRWLIPGTSALLALLIKLGAPGTAHADSTGVDTVAAAQGLDSLAVVAMAAPGVTFGTKVVASVGQALLNSLLYDKFLKTPAVAKLEEPKKKSHH